MKNQTAVMVSTMLILSACAAPPSPTTTPSPDPAQPGLQGGGQEGVSTSTPTATPTATPRPPTAAPMATETPTLMPTSDAPPPPADVPLTAEGPWIVLYSEMNLWVMNADGSGLREFDLGQVQRAEASPFVNGKHTLLAYITAAGMYQTGDPRLHVISIPSLAELANFSLVSEQTADNGVESPNGPRNYQIGQAVTRSLAWSPDGTQLAFVGAMSGTSGDVYVYSRETGAVTHLEGDDYQAADLVWSPDSKTIVNASITDFASGGGHVYDSLWATRADGSSSTQVLGPDVMVNVSAMFDQAWLTDTLLTYSQGGPHLDAVDILTGERSDITAGSIRAISPSRHLLFGGSSDMPGLYFLKSPADSPVKISDELVDSIKWFNQANLFVVGLGETSEDTRLMLVDDSGAVKGTYTRAYHDWSMAPDGTHWASYGLGSGMWVEDIDGLSRQITDDYAVEQAFWSPDGMRLVWLGSDGWRTAESPDYQVVLSAQIPDFYWGYDAKMIWLP